MVSETGVLPPVVPPPSRRRPARLLPVTGAVLLLASLFAQELAAQSSLISVDVYGLRSVAEDQVRAAVGAQAGQPFTDTRDAIQARVEALPGVEEAAVVQVFLGEGSVLFVGIRETGVPPSELRPGPTGDQTLPPEIVDAYDRAMGALEGALRSGQGGEDHEDGHALSHDPAMREQELRLLDYSEEYFLELVEVLHESRDDHQRAVAAFTLAYVEDKSEVIDELVLAARDPSSLVRNNATRALAILGEYATNHPELGLEIDPEPFLTLIESLVWTDRNKGSAALASLSRGRDPALMAALKERSLPFLFEMARWHSTGHAAFPLQTLGRLAGETEEEIQEHMSRAFTDREAQLAWIESLEAALLHDPAATE